MHARANNTTGQTSEINSADVANGGRPRGQADDNWRKTFAKHLFIATGGQPSSSGRRLQNGVYMVELLIALATSTLLAAALVSSMAESERLSNVGQNLIVATTMAQGQIDSTRNTPYNSLAANVGNHELKVKPSSPTGSLIPVVSPRPLLLDSAKFDGRIFETIAAGPYTDTLQVTITINWTEGLASRTYSLTTLVAKNGINNTGTQAAGGV